MAVGEGGGRPASLPSAVAGGRFDEAGAGDFGAAFGAEVREDQIALIGEEEGAVAVGCEMDAGSVLRVGDGVVIPVRFAGAGVEADQVAGGSGGVDTVVLD